MRGPAESTGRPLTATSHDDAMKMETVSTLLALCVENSPVTSPHKGQWCGALMFSLTFAWINGWVNNHQAGDLRRHRTHYDVTVMPSVQLYSPIIRGQHQSALGQFCDLTTNNYFSCSSYCGMHTLPDPPFWQSMMSSYNRSKFDHDYASHQSLQTLLTYTQGINTQYVS